MPHQLAADASFYALVHDLLSNREPRSCAPTRRSTVARDFACLQFVGPYGSGHLPRKDQFRQVLCKELSPHGMSFVDSEPPEGDFIVVGLGANVQTFLSAAVTDCRPVHLANLELTLITVRFIARIRNPGYGALTANPPAYARAILTHT